MGPQPFDCGNEPPDQRGELADRTSMGPQPFDCGNANFAVLQVKLADASMGPQPFDCGNHLCRRRRAAT